MALTDAEIDQLEATLFSEALEEDTLDYFGLHGLVCASIVGPVKLKPDNYIDIVFAEQKDAVAQTELDHFQYCVDSIADQIQESLLEGHDLALPYEQEDEFEACLESWCIGFMEGFFFNEKAWFAQDESATAELLLPIMALSGLFDSAEFEAIEQNDKLMTQFASLIGDQLTDIFLFYHAK